MADGSPIANHLPNSILSKTLNVKHVSYQKLFSQRAKRFKSQQTQPFRYSIGSKTCGVEIGIKLREILRCIRGLRFRKKESQLTCLKMLHTLRHKNTETLEPGACDGEFEE